MITYEIDTVKKLLYVNGVPVRIYSQIDLLKDGVCSRQHIYRARDKRMKWMRDYFFGPDNILYFFKSAIPLLDKGKAGRPKKK